MWWMVMVLVVGGDGFLVWLGGGSLWVYTEFLSLFPQHIKFLCV